MSSHRGRSGSPPSQGLENWGLKELAPGRRRGSGGSLLSSDGEGLVEAWRRGGPFQRGEPLERRKGALCKSLMQGWAPVPHFEALAESVGALAVPWGPAPPLPYTCTPPTTTWMDSWLLPGPDCQLKLPNEAFAKSVPCFNTFSGSLWPKE